MAIKSTWTKDAYVCLSAGIAFPTEHHMFDTITDAKKFADLTLQMTGLASYVYHVQAGFRVGWIFDNQARLWISDAPVWICEKHNVQSPPSSPQPLKTVVLIPQNGVTYASIGKYVQDPAPVQSRWGASTPCPKCGAPGYAGFFGPIECSEGCAR